MRKDRRLFGNNLKVLLVEKEITTEEFAQMIGCTEYNICQIIGFKCCGVCKGTSYSQKQPCNREKCDRKHKGTPNALQYAKDFVFHGKSSSKYVSEIVF